MSQDLTHEAFSACIGDSFRLVPPEGAGAPFDLELITIRELVAADVSRRQKPFAIEFRGPGEKQLSQGMWRLEHPTLGANDIFLVCVGPDDVGLCYEAIFN